MVFLRLRKLFIIESYFPNGTIEMGNGDSRLVGFQQLFPAFVLLEADVFNVV